MRVDDLAVRPAPRARNGPGNVVVPASAGSNILTATTLPSADRRPVDDAHRPPAELLLRACSRRFAKAPVTALFSPEERKEGRLPVGSDPLPGSEIAGFRLEELLGRGGMGAVYRAEDLRLGRKVALKLLAPELAENERFRERFLRESQLAASLDHPHIVPIYAAGDADGQLYLAMRYVRGLRPAAADRARGAARPGARAAADRAGRRRARRGARARARSTATSSRATS